MPAFVTSLLAAAVVLLLGAVPAPAKELPLGSRTLDERRTRTAVAPGVSLTRIARGRVSTGGTAGPWRVDVLTVGPGVRLGVELSDGLIPGREPVSAMAGRVGALAAVNGGFFGSEGVFDGDPIGVLGLGGQLLSEPVGGRAALVLPPARRRGSARAQACASPGASRPRVRSACSTASTGAAAGSRDAAGAAATGPRSGRAGASSARTPASWCCTRRASDRAPGPMEAGWRRS